MFAVVLIIVQIFILIFIGGFARTSQVITTSSYYLGSNMLFLMAWTLMCTPFKKLTLTTLTILILVSALAFEFNLLFGRFWFNVFNQFSTSYELTINVIVESFTAIFVVLLVAIDYAGIFRYWQIYMILVPAMNLIWALNLAVLRYGLKIFDAGGGMSVFLFSGVVSIMLWIICVRQKHEKFGGYDVRRGNHLMRADVYVREEHYDGYSLSLYAMIGTFILWPSVNSSTSLFSSSVLTITSALKTSQMFKNTAYFNTLIALSVGTASSFMLLNRDGTTQGKQRIRCTIDCFINAGIICASFIDIALNPAVVMALSLVSSIATLILYLYYEKIEQEPNKIQHLTSFMTLVLHYSRAIFRIILPLIGSITAAIVVSTRQASTVQLLDTVTYGVNIYSMTAGLEVAGYLITFVFAAIAGLVSGLAINLFLYLKEADTEKNVNTPKKIQQKQINSFTKIQSKIPREPRLNDLNFLQLNQDPQQIFPLYLESQDTFIDEEATARKMLKQAILSHVKQNYASINNYISLNNNKNVRTNNTGGGMDDKTNNSALPNPAKKLNFQINKDFILKNNVSSPKAKQIQKQLTPQSSQSQIKNQTKEIVDLVNKDRTLFRDKSLERQAMPNFYVDHMIKGANSKLQLSSTPKQMMHSKTQSYLQNKKQQKRDSKAPVEIRNSRVSVGISLISSPEKSVIKRTMSVTELKYESPVKKQLNKDMLAISEMQKQEQDYRSRNINNSKRGKSNIRQNIGIVDQGSQIMEQNQNQSLKQNSQAI